MMVKNSLKGKIVLLMAKDHSSSINIDKDDLERIRAGVAHIIVIGLVIEDDADKLLLGSFFSDFNGEHRYYEVHSILKNEIVDIDVLETSHVADS